ncbi:hypothetical protein F5X96DRAFT_567685 [Biscogniauxia mediterranea]|nr:hypothetical protein F5X96DRAFT_567685 [Biscogniauxia mediterranea]
MAEETTEVVLAGSPPAPSASPPPVPSEAKKVTLDVGGRKFVTTSDTLGHSTFFLALLSGRWEHARQEDGSYFIDADPGRFEDILAFLRRGTMPLYWSAEGGHDYPRYHRLLDEARYFGLPELEHWLATQAYHKAVAYQTQVVTKDAKGTEGGASTTTTFLDPCRPEVHVRWVDDNEYYCCAGIRRHHRHPELCDHNCFKYREDVEIPVERRQKAQVTVVSTKVHLFAAEFRAPQHATRPPPYQAA